MRTNLAPKLEHYYTDTISGGFVDLMHPKPEQIKLTDIAYGLSRLPRFLGQTLGEPYSVAAHSLWVSAYLYRTTGDTVIALHGLMHDSPETYTGDVVTQIKNYPGIYGRFRTLENRLHAVIMSALDIPAITGDIVRLIRVADRIALAREAAELKRNIGTHWDLPGVPEVAMQIELPRVSPHAIELAFLDAFALLKAGKEPR